MQASKCKGKVLSLEFIKKEFKQLHTFMQYMYLCKTWTALVSIKIDTD